MEAITLHTHGALRLLTNGGCLHPQSDNAKLLKLLNLQGWP